MKKCVFSVSYVYLGLPMFKRVVVVAQDLGSAWNKVVWSLSEINSVIDIRFVEYFTDEK